MFSRKAILVLAAIVLLSIFVFDACAQWSPGGMAVNFGDLKLAGSQGSSGSGTYVIGMTAANSQNTNSSLESNSSMNSSVANSPKAMAVLDLSNYARDRRNNNLTGYSNIMYPFAESKGSTTSTAGAGGCGCGG